MAAFRFVMNTAPRSEFWNGFRAGLSVAAPWQVSTAVGLLVGARAPESWGLDFALALTFLAIVIPLLGERPSVAANLFE